MLGTCVTFSATASLAQTVKGGAHRGGAKLKNYYTVAVAREKMVLIRAISAPFSNQILPKNLYKLLLL